MAPYKVSIQSTEQSTVFPLSEPFGDVKNLPGRAIKLTDEYDEYTWHHMTCF